MNSGLLTEIEMMALEVPVGTSKRFMCPSCLGGNSREKSLSITRFPDSVKFNCFRDNCPTGGIIGASARVQAHKPVYTKDTSYWGEYIPVNLHIDVPYFEQRFELKTVSALSWIGHDAAERYIMPIYGPLGEKRGYVVRQIPWKGTPECPRKPTVEPSGGSKVKSYPDTETTIMLSWYGTDPGTFVLVEDQISAMKVANAGLTGVALLGAGLDIHRVREIQQQSPKEVVFALDADASKTAFRLAKEYGLAFPKTRVVLLERDIKDTPAADVLSVLQIKP